MTYALVDTYGLEERFVDVAIAECALLNGFEDFGELEISSCTPTCIGAHLGRSLLKRQGVV